jgi:transcriptional regulator with XRE-family HTH domain
MNIGKIIKSLREAKKWTQDELAFRVDTSTANISRIENGKHQAGQLLLESLAKQFNYRVYQLIALAEGVETPIIPVNSNPKEEQLLANFRSMNEEQKELFIAIGIQFQLIDKSVK